MLAVQHIILALLFCLRPGSFQTRISFSELKFYHKAVLVDGAHVSAIAQMSNDLSVFWRAFDAIAVVRVPGTPSHLLVQNFIKTEMTNLDWTITEDKFMNVTPVGVLPFNNIIATHNPAAKRFLDLACHYDSKYFAEFAFVGAIDSAAPCAMMIQMAHNLGKILQAKRNPELGLRFLFLDGEEAFVSWSEQDSTYGAQHLAAKWESEPYPEGGGDSNQLDRIDMLMLLDLLGAKNPTFYNFFSNTQSWYKLLVGAEEKLQAGNHLSRRGASYFKRMSTLAGIEDDHLPFLNRNVPILHIIPVPFPKVWHKASDNRNVIDEPTVSNLIKILSTFVSEYLHLHN